MVSAFIRFGDGRISREADPATLLAAARDQAAVFWVDLAQPTDEEYALLDDVFGFHPLAIEDCTQYSQSPKIESYNHVGDAFRQGYFFMVIHGPDLETFRNNLRTRELDLFTSERYLVTVHEEPMRTISDLQVRGNTDPRIILDPGIDLLLHGMLDKLVDAYMPILDSLQDNLDDLEEQATDEPTHELLPKITQKKRELLNLRRIIAPQRDVLAQLTRGEVPFIRESTRIYFRDVLDHLNRDVELIELYRDLALGARDIYMSSVSNNLNRIMKTLTIITVVALPMNVITGFFGMNFEYLPGLHSVRFFWLTMGTMAMAVTALLIMFVRKRWL